MKRRRATEEDFDDVFAVHREAFREHVETLWGPWDDDWQRENFRREFAESICEVLVVDDKAVGFVQYVDQPDCVRIWNLALRPEFRGKGAGTRLLQEFQERARGCNVELRLRVFPTNDRAYGFYLKLGFRETSRSRTAVELVWS